MRASGREKVREKVRETTKSRTLFLSLCFLPPMVLAQVAPQPGPPVILPADVHSFPQHEDAVASLFNTLRKEAKLHHLSRSKGSRSNDSAKLQRLTCTVSINDKVPVFSSGVPLLGSTPEFKDRPSALYKTATPGEVTPELQRIARYNHPDESPHYARYSVAVWPAQGQAAAGEQSADVPPADKPAAGKVT